MLRHFPIDAGVSFDCVMSSVRRFDWLERTAHFVIPDDPVNVLQVRFHSQVVVRMLDEFALSVESDPATWDGLVSNHLAYRVEGAQFAATQSKFWKQFEGGTGGVTHYRFITGSGCLDVLSASEPEFAVVPSPPA